MTGTDPAVAGEDSSDAAPFDFQDPSDDASFDFQAAAHVLERCRSGRFPWAHAYVDRLVADHPNDPHPLVLRALIHAYRGENDAYLETVAAARRLDPVVYEAHLAGVVEWLIASETAGGDRFTWKDAGGCLLGLAAVAGLTLVGAVVAGLFGFVGGKVGDRLGLNRPGDDSAGLLFLAGVVLLLRTLWWAGKVTLKGPGVRAEFARLRTDRRRAASQLDDDDLRVRGALIGMVLPVSLIAALLPTSYTGMTPAGGGAVLVWAAALVLGVLAWTAFWYGTAKVVRIFLVSRLLTAHATAALLVICAFAFALVRGTPESTLDAAGSWWVPAAVLATIATSLYARTLSRRVERQRRLQQLDTADLPPDPADTFGPTT